jgi:Putative transmembrane protein (PGPGW)
MSSPDTNVAARRPTAEDGLGQPAQVPRGSWRDRLRSKAGVGQAYRAGVFVAGMVFIVLGFGLAVLPGPLTIPPVLLGLWIWSTEFRFARRFFDSFKRKAKDAWTHARAHPVSSAAITVGGLAAAGAALWAVSYFELVATGKDAIGF